MSDYISREAALTELQNPEQKMNKYWMPLPEPPKEGGEENG